MVFTGFPGVRPGFGKPQIARGSKINAPGSCLPRAIEILIELIAMYSNQLIQLIELKGEIAHGAASW
jgi:hypothetical protein